ncbi:hypothetical protein DRJ17_04685 [Candidatus Woesearchaeota archaeon]|nr:MAG: hypothetical protein DRJ17_04685 [Candidatus Woesearchaeota archaeon]
MRIGVTGHRPRALPGGYNLDHPANKAILRWLTERLHELKPSVGCTGMALGVDQLFCLACVETQVPYVAFVPCAGQDRVWPPKSQALYKRLLEAAHEVRMVSSKPYFRGCMEKRNAAMKDWLLEEEGSVLLAVYAGLPGGTRRMIEACKSKLEIIVLDPRKIK